MQQVNASTGMANSSNKRRNSAPKRTRNLQGRRYKSAHIQVRSRRRIVLALLYVALLVILVVGILTTPLLSLRHATLYGTGALTPEEALAVEKSSVIRPGMNTLFLNQRKIESRLKSIACIKTSRVYRTGINSFGIAVTPRTPYVLLKKPGAFYQADENGSPIRQVSLNSRNRLPVINLPANAPIILGQTLSDDTVMSAIQILKNAHYHPLIRIAKIDIDQTGNLCLNMMDGIIIKFGLPESIPAKMEFVQNVYLCTAPAKQVTSINISCLEHPVCTERIVLPASPVLLNQPGSAKKVPNAPAKS